MFFLRKDPGLREIFELVEQYWEPKRPKTKKQPKGESDEGEEVEEEVGDEDEALEEKDDPDQDQAEASLVENGNGVETLDEETGDCGFKEQLQKQFGLVLGSPAPPVAYTPRVETTASAPCLVQEDVPEDDITARLAVLESSSSTECLLTCA